MPALCSHPLLPTTDQNPAPSSKRCILTPHRAAGFQQRCSHQVLAKMEAQGRPNGEKRGSSSVLLLCVCRLPLPSTRKQLLKPATRSQRSRVTAAKTIRNSSLPEESFTKKRKAPLFSSSSEALGTPTIPCSILCSRKLV